MLVRFLCLIGFILGNPRVSVGLELQQLTNNGAGYNNPTYTPDGTEIIFSRDKSLYAIPSNGGSATALFTFGNESPEDPSVAPNGEVFFTRRGDSLHVWKFNRTAETFTQITSGVAGHNIDRWPEIDPTGQHLLFGSLGGTDYDAWRMDLSLGESSALQLTSH